MSHTTIMLLAGLVLLILLRLTIRDAAWATRLFLILWLLVAIGNLLVGVLHAGYGWAEEAGIALVVFGMPAALALLVRRFWR
ncbi:hypothetical protein FG91_01189 [Sphingopyxis sp. LC81]|uniref:hypothetical protein n=1 Tax=Sphingopyxis sp. LC81 TaxID=1502850 RepID=UPI00050D90B2|nr:hypothetical protein [Sphingopyxis sp. LC81]KGB55805.1 hypothetical protein FG91_01189 [Sphingopyxis sp. LC81]